MSFRTTESRLNFAGQKNTNEERDPPAQILFGSRNWRYCVVSLFTVWLEYHFELNSEENKFYFGYKGATDPDLIKASAAYFLKNDGTTWPST